METEAGECLQSIKNTKMRGIPSENETLQQICSEDHAQLGLAEEEPCKCKCLMQALEEFKNKAAALEEVNKRSIEAHKSQVLEWNSERERLLELVSELESNSNAKDEKMKGFQEQLSIAECAVEQLTKSRAELLEEVSRLQLETSQAHDKLTDSECAALSRQKIKENEIGRLSAALHARNIAFESVQADIADKERMINEFSTQLSSLQDVQQQYALLQQECSVKTRDLQRLSESHKDLKSQFQAVVEGHEREMDCMTGKLQEALDSQASKDSRIEAITSELNGLQLALENVKAFNKKADLASCRLQEDLALAGEAQYNNQLGLEKAVKEVAALREALMAKDNLNASLKAQQIHQEKMHQQKGEALEKDLQKYKSVEKELLLILEQEQRKVTTLEDLRKKDLEAAKVQENGWTDEREKLIMDVSSMHNLIESREILVQELEEKLLRADDAIRHATDTRAHLQEENSELRMRVQEAQMQLRDAESSLELLEKAKEGELISLSNLLQAKLIDLETAQQEMAQHQRTITAMAADLVNFQELQREHASLKEALKRKEEEVHALLKSEEKSRLQLKALEDEYHKDNDHLIVQLDKALECKARAEKSLEEYKNELGCLRAALEKANVSRTESEVEREKLLDNLATLQEENSTLQHNMCVLEEHIREDAEALKGSISKKENELKELKQQIAELEGTLSCMTQQEKQWQDGVVECEALRRELKQKHLLHSELHELHQKALLQWSEKEEQWLTQMETLNSRAHMAEENLTVTDGKLQTALSDLQCLKARCKECEQKMSAYEGEIAQLQMKLDESNTQLQSGKQEFQNLQDKLQLTSSTLTTLLQEKDFALSEANKRLDGLESEVLVQSNKNIVCADQIESLKKESQLYEARIQDLNESVAHLKESLLEAREESSRAIETKEAVEVDLSNTREELRLAKRESELQIQMLGHAISVSEGKLQQALESMQRKQEELDALLTCLESKDSAINEMKILKSTLMDEKEVLIQSVNSLQAKVEMHALALENEKSVSQQLCSCVEEKERTIASKSQEVRDLQHLLNLSQSETQKVNAYQEKLRSLEEELTEASASLHDKEERLTASEWAVQQLANEISKAKSSLAQKEREEVLLQSRLSDMETRSKAKDRELVEVDCYVQSLVKKNSHKQLEVERLTQAIATFESRTNEWNVERQELMSEIGRISSLLEDKVAELVHLEEQLKQRQIRENMMEDAILCLKSQLAEQALLLDEQESKSQQLVEELETARIQKELIAGSLKEAESKLQQADQRLKEETDKLRTDLLETQEKLSFSSLSGTGLEQDLLAALEEIKLQKSKHTQASAAFESRTNEWNVERQEFMSEIGRIGSLLEDKVAELVHLEEQLKQRQVRENMMDDAIQCLKSQLADRALLFDEQESKSQQLVQELENARIQKDLIAESLKDAEIKLQQADQRLEEETDKLRTNLLETQEKLSLSFLSHTGLERDLLAALEETELQKRKLCSLSELSAAKDSSLEELGCKLDALQEELAEQKKHMNQRNEELVRMKEELDYYTDKEKKLSDEICNLSEKMLQQKEALTKDLDIVAAKMSLKDEEIEQLKVIQESMQSMSTERESLIDEVTKLRKELTSSSKTVWDREADITRLKEMRKNLEAELVKAREVMVKTEHALKSTSAKLMTAENKCLALEGELKNTVVELQTQVEKTNSLAALISHLKEELEAKENVLHVSNTQTESALDDLNSKMDSYCRKEASMEAQAAMLLKEMREILHESRQHEAERTKPLTTEILALLGQDGNNAIEFLGKEELAKVFENSEHVLASKNSEELQGGGLQMFAALQMVVQELQIEGQRRRRIEGIVFELTRNVVLKLAAKEQEIQGLIGELDFLKKAEEDWGKRFKESLRAQIEFESELSMAMALTHPAEPQLQSNSLQARASITDMKQLSESWGLIINAYKECILSIIRLIREEAAQSSCKLNEVDNALIYSGSWAERLQGELTQLKQIMKMLLQEVHEKDSALADAVKEVEILRSSLREEAEKERGAQEQISTLQSFLIKSRSALSDIEHGNFEHFNASSEMESPEAAFTEESGSLRSELERSSLLAEELHRQIMSRAIELGRELARWREEAESALNLNNHFAAQLAELKLKVKHFEEKEQCVEGELRDVKKNFKAMKDEASNLMSQLMKAAEMTRQLELQVEKKEEELACVEVQVNDLKLELEAAMEKNQDLISELATAKQLMEEEKAGLQISLGKWKEKASIAHDEMQALQSELNVSQQGMERITEEMHHLQLELHDWKGRAEMNAKDNDLLRLQLDTLLQATEDLQGRLDTAENAKQRFENSCQRLEADLASARDASREREKLLDDALTRLQEGSRHNRMTVEARFQVLYDAMMYEDEDDDDERAAQLRGGHPNAEKDDISSLKTGSQTGKLTSKGPTFLQQRSIDDDDGCNKERANSSLFFASQLSPANSLKVEGGQGVEDSQQDLDHYLELCDSLIRRHARLEKQLENLVTSKTALNQQAEGCSGMEEKANESENKKRRLLDVQEKGSTRKPLQPIIPSQQVAVATTPSPCAKRRRSNNSSPFEDQNASQ